MCVCVFAQIYISLINQKLALMKMNATPYNLIELCTYLCSRRV